MHITTDRVVITMTQLELSAMIDNLTIVCSLLDEIVTPRNSVELRNAHAALQELHRRLCADDIAEQLRRALAPILNVGG